MTKGSAGNFFEDFSLGQRFACPTPRALGSGEIAQYIALCGDRTPRFCGADGRLHPLLVFHCVLGQTVRPISLNARANLGYAQLLWGAPVFAGAEISAEVEVVGLKENSSGRSGIVWVDTTGRDQEGRVVLSFVRWVMVHKRTDQPTQWADQPTVPALWSNVDTSLLCAEGPPPDPVHTGGAWLFEDYRVGERIFHRDGHTVTEAEHMSFTRLFQNSARVHFDALLTEGRPLVFGGYPMSIGYAQSFNGLENRLGIAAINGGTHANPVQAGDTLYTLTEVLETKTLATPELGALRLRMVVVKNQCPGASAEFSIREGQGYHPNVVLDLDYWEPMLR